MRQPGIELFRIVSILGVVIIHVGPGKTISGDAISQVLRFSVPFFFIIAGYLFYCKIDAPKHALFKNLIKYEWRLFYLYLIWYVVYSLWTLLAPGWSNNMPGGGFWDKFLKEFLLLSEQFKTHKLYFIGAGGSGGHLWFLPSLGLAILLLGISVKYGYLWEGFVFSLILFTIGLLVGPYKHTVIGLPFGFNPRNGPFFSCVFVMMGALFGKYRIRVSLKIALFITFLGLFLSVLEVIVLNQLYGIDPTIPDYLFATTIYAGGVALTALSSNHLGRVFHLFTLGKFTLGIYLSHVLIMHILVMVNVYPTSRALKIPACLVGSLILTIVLFYTPVFRRTVS